MLCENGDRRSHENRNIMSCHGEWRVGLTFFDEK